MSHFVPNLKKDGYLDEISITIGIIGSRKLESFDDHVTASKGWEVFVPNLTIYGFDADVSACTQMNAYLAAQNITWVEKHIPVALWESEGESEIYITREPGCISLHRPSEEYLQRFTAGSKAMELIDSQIIDTTTLDAFCQAENIDTIDVLQLDVQGGELQVLKGASEILKRSTLAIITEVEFMELYTKQPLFSDVDVYLREKEFSLFDLSNIHRDHRRDMPLISIHHPGPPMWADAFYFRDLISRKYKNHLQTPSTMLKLACIADILSFPDYALEILEYLTVNYGSDKKYNFAANIIETLSEMPELLEIPEVAKNGLESLPIISKMQTYL